jgi:cation:H+ antiporter
VRFLKLLAAVSHAGASALSALWTFPSILLSAFLVAWGAEAAQFLMSQGLALAILAWLQTLPEFAVEAVIAWEAGADPERAHLAIANLTGAIRLLLGLGWPAIYFVFLVAGRRTARQRLPSIHLEHEHAVEVLGLVPPLLYFLVILWKQKQEEELSDAPPVSRWAYRQRGWRRPAAIGGLFALGGTLLYLTAHPFLESMLAVAGLFGIGQFFLVQWVAPFLSEFPDFVSTINWARRVTRAPMALMNIVSSNINQWTILAAMIPLVYGFSHLHHHGVWSDFHFDGPQRLEILLTLLQTLLGVLLLANMEFDWLDASALFVLWLVQFLVPHLREEVSLAYGAWIVVLAGQFVLGRKRFLVWKYFLQTVQKA